MGDEAKINLVYIDDQPEIALSAYLNQYSKSGCEIEYKEVLFETENGYEKLIANNVVKSANVIIIDSKLFENRSVASSKFSGEEFKLILKRWHPFIEVLVITQNDIEEGYQKIKKYNSQSGETASEYYERTIPNALNPIIDDIIEYMKIAERLKVNKSLETVLVEKVTNSVNGITEYDELTKSDIDRMIEVFKEVQAKFDEK